MAHQYNIPEIDSPLLPAPTKAIARQSTARSEFVDELYKVIDERVEQKVGFWITQRGIKEWCEENSITLAEAAEQICAAKATAKTAAAEISDEILLSWCAEDYDDDWNPTGCLHNFKAKPPPGKKYYGYCASGNDYFCPTHVNLKPNQATLKKILAVVGFDVRTIRQANAKARKTAGKKGLNDSKVTASGGSANVPQMRVIEDTGVPRNEPVKVVPRYVPFIDNGLERPDFVRDEITNLVGKKVEGPDGTEVIRIVGLFNHTAKQTRGLTAAQKETYTKQGFTMN